MMLTHLRQRSKGDAANAYACVRVRRRFGSVSSLLTPRLLATATPTDVVAATHVVCRRRSSAVGARTQHSAACVRCALRDATRGDTSGGKKGVTPGLALYSLALDCLPACPPAGAKALKQRHALLWLMEDSPLSGGATRSSAQRPPASAVHDTPAAELAATLRAAAQLADPSAARGAVDALALWLCDGRDAEERCARCVAAVRHGAPATLATLLTTPESDAAAPRRAGVRTWCDVHDACDFAVAALLGGLRCECATRDATRDATSAASAAAAALAAAGVVGALSARMCARQGAAALALAALVRVRDAPAVVARAFGIRGSSAVARATPLSRLFLERCLMGAGGFFDADVSFAALKCLTCALEAWPCLASQLVDDSGGASSDAPALDGAAVPLLLGLTQHYRMHTLGGACRALAALLRAGGARVLQPLVTLHAAAVPVLAHGLLELLVVGPDEDGVPGVETCAVELLLALFSAPGVLCAHDGAYAPIFSIIVHHAVTYATRAAGVSMENKALVNVRDASQLEHMLAALTSVLQAAITAPDADVGPAVLGALRAVLHGDLVLQRITARSPAAANLAARCSMQSSAKALRRATRAAEEAEQRVCTLEKMTPLRPLVQGLIQALHQCDAQTDFRRCMTLRRAATMAMSACPTRFSPGDNLICESQRAVSTGFFVHSGPMPSEDDREMLHAATTGLHHFTCGGAPELLLVADVPGISELGRTELSQALCNWAAAMMLRHVDELRAGSPSKLATRRGLNLSDIREPLATAFKAAGIQALPPDVAAAAKTVVMRFVAAQQQRHASGDVLLSLPLRSFYSEWGACSCPVRCRNFPEAKDVPQLVCSVGDSLRDAGAAGAAVAVACARFFAAAVDQEPDGAHAHACSTCALCLSARANGTMCALPGCGARARRLLPPVTAGLGGSGGASFSDSSAPASLRALWKCNACRRAACCCAEHQRTDWRRHKSECSGGE